LLKIDIKGSTNRLDGRKKFRVFLNLLIARLIVERSTKNRRAVNGQQTCITSPNDLDLKEGISDVLKLYYRLMFE